MAKVNYINGYNIDSNDKFFIDANVWLYVYGPIGDYDEKSVQKYSAFLEKIIDSGNKVYVCSSLISEILNRYMRIEFKIAQEEDGIKDYKREFRNNEAYKEVIESIEAIINEKILKKCIPINDEFNTFNYESTYLGAGMDFNDSLYCHIAMHNDLKIVTNDKDFRKSQLPIEVITY